MDGPLWGCRRRPAAAAAAAATAAAAAAAGAAGWVFHQKGQEIKDRDTGSSPNGAYRRQGFFRSPCRYSR